MKRNKKEEKIIKRLLIKGSVEKIPQETIEDESFRKYLRKVMKDWCGIYVLYKGDEVYYVGQTNSSFWRLWTHFKRSANAGKWDKFSVFRFNAKHLDSIETLLLHISKPKGNTNIPRIPKDREFTNVLRKEAKEARRKAIKLERAIRR